MRIERLAIDGFGLHRDLHLEFTPGLNVLLGPNEAGKSTLHAFLRAMFHGLPRGGPKYEPLAGGRHGGALTLARDGERFRVERIFSPRKSLRVLDESGANLGEAALKALLGNVDAALHRNIFAFDLDDLRELGLESDEIERRLFDAGLLGAGRSLASLRKELRAAKEEVLRPRSGPIRELAKEIAELRQALAEKVERSMEHADRLRKEEAIVRAIEEARRKRTSLQAALRRWGLLLSLWPDELERRRLLALLRSLPPAKGSAPALEEALARHDALREREHALRGQLERLERERVALVAEIGSLSVDEKRLELDPQLVALEQERRLQEELLEKVAVLERSIVERSVGLLSLVGGAAGKERALPATEALEEPSKRFEQLRVFQRERERAEQGLAARGPTIAKPMLFLGALAFGASGALLALDEPVAALVASLASLVLAAVGFLARAGGSSEQGRRLSLERWERALAAWEARESAYAERDRLLERQAAWMQAARELLAEAGLSNEGGDFAELRLGLATLRSAIEEERQKASRREGLIGRLEALERSLETCRMEVEAAAGERARCLEEVEAESREALVERLRCEKEREEARRALLRLERSFVERVGEGELGDEVRKRLERGERDLWETEEARTREALEAVEARLEHLHAELALLRRELEEEEASTAIPELSVRLEQRKAAWGELIARYRKAALLERLLDAALEELHDARQPAVLRSASAFFRVVTAERYVQIRQMREEQQVEVVTASGAAVSARDLSRGAREQLYLCLRLGLADAFAEQGTRLPLLMDDVLVNFDPERARAMAKVLADAAERHQLLLFTCHPDTVALLEREAQAHRIELPGVTEPRARRAG